MRSISATVLSTGLAVTVATFSWPRPADAVVQPAASNDADQEAQVRSLYQTGATLFATADYEGAIESFTQALKIANTYGADAQVRGALLFNIGKSRMKAFEVSRDPSELRQALAIYTRFVDDAKAGAGYTEKDVADAEREISNIRDTLAELEKNQAAPPAQPPPKDAADEPAVRPTKSSAERDTPNSGRKVAKGLLIGGGVGLAAGLGMVGYGFSFRPHAQAEIDDRNMGVHVDPSEFDSVQQGYYDTEVTKGKAVIGSGIGLAVVGTALLIVGGVKLRKSKKDGRSAQVTLVPMGRSGLAIVGRF